MSDPATERLREENRTTGRLVWFTPGFAAAPLLPNIARMTDGH